MDLGTTGGAYLLQARRNISLPGGGWTARTGSVYDWLYGQRHGKRYRKRRTSAICA